MDISVVIDKLDKAFKGKYNFGNRSLEITSVYSPFKFDSFPSCFQQILFM